MAMFASGLMDIFIDLRKKIRIQDIAAGYLIVKEAEGVGCGNEIEDSIKNGFVKIPSWPLYYSLLANDVKKGFEITLEKSNLYLKDARLAIELLPEEFSHKEFLEFLFLTVDHYNHFWYNQLQKADKWSEFESKLPR